MNLNTRTLIHHYLDGITDDKQQRELGDWIKQCPENAFFFAEEVALHNHLADIIQAHNEVVCIAPAETLAIKSPFTWNRMWGTVGLVLAACLILLLYSGIPRLNAGQEFQKLLDGSGKFPDRTYRIQSLDSHSDTPDEHRLPLDGAILHVRNPDKFVLIGTFPNGDKFQNGSDGDKGWSVPPRGRVQISNDPMRFRGALPGHHHGIPFVNLKMDLIQLREAYSIGFSSNHPNGWPGITLSKKSNEYRGPRNISIWYDRDSGVIQQMDFHGMPKARGGPDSLSVTLINTNPLGDSFFQHHSHHEADRIIQQEEFQ